MADRTEHEDGHPPVGSVADEAARLLDALGGWVSTSGYAAGKPPGSVPPGSVPPGSETRDETASHPASHCDQCGAANGTGQAVTCQWCPVCQGIGLLRSVRPETVDRLADLAGALASALRDVASHSRSTAGTTDGTHDTTETRPRGPRVQDITIEDEDQGSATR